MQELISRLAATGFNVSPTLTNDYIRFDRTKPLSGYFKCWEIKSPHGEVLEVRAKWGDWAAGEKYNWAGGIATSNMTAEELAAHRSAMEEALAAQEAEKAAAAAAAALEARDIYSRATSVSYHPYLKRKGILGRSPARIFEDKLCIPVFIDGQISSLQMIDAEGRKRFLTNGKINAGYSWIAAELPITPPTKVYVCEGYATAASVFEALNEFTLVAFNAGNLPKLAASYQWGTAEIIVCADNDYATPGNPGLTYARKAVEILRGQGLRASMIYPEFEPALLEKKLSDWNDYHQTYGLDALRKVLQAAPMNDIHKNEETLPRDEPIVHRATLPAESDFQFPTPKMKKDGTPGKVQPLQVVEKMIERFGDLLMRDGRDVFARTPTHWEELDQVSFEYYMVRVAMRLLRGEGTNDHAKAIYALFKAYLPTPPKGQSFYQQNPALTNFLDGTLEVKKGAGGKFELHFRAHARTDLLTWVLPYRYSEAGGENQLFKDWLNRCFQGDADAEGKIRALKQVGGACLVSLFPRYVFLYGPGGTGKSTFAKLCMRFLSMQNVCSIEPKDQGGTFGKETMVNKQVNIVTDISGAKIDSALFKRREDRVPEYINRKGRGAIMGYLPAVDIYCTNILPRGIDGESSAMDRRASILEFGQSVVEGGNYSRDYDLALVNAGPGAILRFFLDGLEDLCQSGGIYFNPESGKQRLQEWKDSESLTAQFLSALAHGEIDHLELAPNDKIERTKVSQALATWCGRLLPNQQLSAVFHDLNARGFKHAATQGKRYIRGIRVIGVAGSKPVSNGF